MIIINSIEKSKCVNIFSDHGESVIFNGDPVWAMSIDDGFVHLSLYIRNSDDALPRTCNIGHIPEFVYNVYKSEKLDENTPVAGKRISWKLNAVRTTTVNDKTDVPVGPVEIYPGYSEKADLLRLIDDSLPREVVIERLNRYYKLLDETRLAIYQNENKLDKQPLPPTDPAYRVLSEVLP